MPSLNRVEIIGHLGRDPEVKTTPSNITVTSFSVATTESWKDKTTGEKQEKTEWHKIIAWRGLGEVCGKILKKGSLVYIDGKMQTRSYEGKDGGKRYVTEIVANQMQKLNKDGSQSETGGDGEGGDGIPF